MKNEGHTIKVIPKERWQRLVSFLVKKNQRYGNLSFLYGASCFLDTLQNGVGHLIIDSPELALKRILHAYSGAFLEYGDLEGDELKEFNENLDNLDKKYQPYKLFREIK